MKKLFIPTALSIMVIANLSCSRANYADGRTQNSPQTISETTSNDQTQSNHQTNAFEILEGEKKSFSVTLDETLSEDATFQWRILADERNSDVNVQSRLKTIEGTTSAKAQDGAIQIEIAAQDIDQEKQGDQYYKIILINASSQSSMTAELKLIDQVTETGIKALAMSSDVINDNHMITLSLNEAASEDIIVDIETEDQTAKAGINYQGIKKQVIIPQGETQIQISLDLIKVNCEKEKTFLVKLKTAQNIQILNESVQVIVAEDQLCSENKDKGTTLD